MDKLIKSVYRHQNRSLSTFDMANSDSIASEKPASAQPAPMYSAHPSYQRFQYPTPSYNNVTSQGKYANNYGGTQLADAFAGLGVSGQNPMGTGAGLKPIQNSMDIQGLSRPAAYGNNPLMVLPSGQTIPLQSIYGHGATSATDQASQLQYIPTGMFPNFVSNTNMMASSMPGYGWQYSLQNDVPALDVNRRGSWSSNDENGPTTPGMGMNGHQDYYANVAGLDRAPMVGFPYATPSPPSVVQPYIAGPMQPMKCPDNKNYESVNLDILTQQPPTIPRAVPALWTNQEDLSLAKCLQNPEGITNIYIRGFLPEVTDQDIHDYAARFGEIESCKAIVDMDTGKCKGFVNSKELTYGADDTTALASSNTIPLPVPKTAFEGSFIWATRPATHRYGDMSWPCHHKSDLGTEISQLSPEGP
jgi:RNA recognition motif. (a.k.a. RRM, RBD, or RNP domain)